MKFKILWLALFVFNYPAFAQKSIDVLVFGNKGSEISHELKAELSETYKGQLKETARRFLPQTPTYFYGGEATFFMDVKPDEQNYFTVKYSGDEYEPNNGRIILEIEGGEVGWRYGEQEESVFIEANVDGPVRKGAFIYRTVPVPINLSKGKSRIKIRLRSTGNMFNYGNRTYESFQKKLEKPSRGVYRAYTHTNPVLVLANDDKQGIAASYQAAPKRPAQNADELLKQYKEKINNYILLLLNGPDYIPTTSNNNFNEVEYLAFAYQTSWTIAYHQQAAIDKIVTLIDSHSKEYIKDNKKVATWGGAYGRPSNAVCLVYDQLKKRLDEMVDFGQGSKTRKDYWSAIFKASFNYGRTTRNLVTNQDLECIMSVYGANMALQKIDSAKAIPEADAKEYIYEAIGLKEWPAKDLDTTWPRKKSWDRGHGYYMMTEKGTTHETGWVSQNGYGNMGPKILEIYQMCKDEKVKEVAIKHEKIQDYFHYATVDKDGYRVIASEDVISWRNQHHPGRMFYGDPWVAAESGDAALTGYVKQMMDDNQFLLYYTSAYNVSYLKESKALLTPEVYEKIKASTSKVINPCTPGEPDYAVADEENGVVTWKRGNEQLAVQLWRRGKAINYLAMAHQITLTDERVVEFRPEDVRFTPSGKELIRNGDVNHHNSPQPPDHPQDAYKGIKQPLPLLPDGTTNEARSIAEFYGCRYGDYIIAMNTTKRTWNRTFKYKIPVKHQKALELITGKTVDLPTKLIVKPGETYVYYIGKSDK